MDSPKASRYMIWQGKEILRGTGFLQGTVIYCPSEHIIRPDMLLLGDGVAFCDHREGKGQAPCGALIYLQVIAGRGATKRIWLADCTREEMREIERLGLDADGVRAYFGASFPR
jgi:hypothetical protein